MAPDSVHTAEINLKDLTVKTVTLGPERATVVGEILDVPIKVGLIDPIDATEGITCLPHATARSERD